MWSSWALLLPIQWGDYKGVLRISIVGKDIPPLMSRRVLKVMDVDLQMGKDQAVIHSMGSVTTSLSEMEEGHVAIQTCNFDDQKPEYEGSCVQACHDGAEVSVEGSLCVMYESSEAFICEFEREVAPSLYKEMEEREETWETVNEESAESEENTRGSQREDAESEVLCGVCETLHKTASELESKIADEAGTGTGQTEAGPKVTQLKVEGVGEQVRLSWNWDGPEATFEIFRNGDSLAIITEYGFTDTPLLSGSTDYTVKPIIDDKPLNSGAATLEGFIVESVDPKSNEVSTTGGLITGLVFILISIGSIAMVFFERRD